MTITEIIKFLKGADQQLKDEGYVPSISLLIEKLEIQKDEEEYEYWKKVGATAPVGSGQKKLARHILVDKFGEDFDDPNYESQEAIHYAVEEDRKSKLTQSLTK